MTVSATETKAMPAMAFSVRPMAQADVRQVAEIERQAFPTLFPPTPFRRELGKRNASYLVAFEDRAEAIHPEPGIASPTAPSRGRIAGLARLAVSVLGGSSHVEQAIAGFIGLWYMVDEAHVVTVGVGDGYRGCGVGELLLMSAIEQALARRAAVVTLEVRPSNSAAIALYGKYGFAEQGLRKAYYSDNREDALIMTTAPIQQPSYRERLSALTEAHRLRWGDSRRISM